jgi:superfamily II DNA or RNA helicase
MCHALCEGRFCGIVGWVTFGAWPPHSNNLAEFLPSLAYEEGRMAEVELNETFLAKIAGWEAVKSARALLAGGRVLSSNWTPPVLKGVVQEGTASYRATLIIKDLVNVENMCTCRQAREWGTICAHAVAVGLHHLHRGLPPKEAPVPAKSPARPHSDGAKPASTLRASRLRWAREGEVGVPLELFLIMPPNLEAALARGRVMVCFEIRTPRGRGPLSTLSLASTYHASEQDRALLERIEVLAVGEFPGLLQLEVPQLAALLSLCVGHPRITQGRSAEVQVLAEPGRLPLKAHLEKDGMCQLSRADSRALPPLLVGEGDRHWTFAAGRFTPVHLHAKFLPVLRTPVWISRADLPLFLNRDWPTLVRGGATSDNLRPEEFQIETLKPRFALRLTGGLAQLEAHLSAVYGQRKLPLGAVADDQDTWIPDDQDIRKFGTRDLEAERGALGRLLRCGFSAPDPQGRMAMSGQNTVLNFFAREHPRLEREWQVTMEERLQKSCSTQLERVEPQFAVSSSGVEWFDFSVSFRLSGGDTLSAAEMQRLLLSGQSHGRLRNGKIAVFDAAALDEFQESLRDCSPRQEGQAYRISTKQASFLEATVRDQGWTLQAPAPWKEKVRHRSGEALPECPPLGSLEEVLRPYQKHGVAWFQFLRSSQFGGILADEMGLGKTLQTLAFLRAMRAQGEIKLPWLVICPTSLVFNWVLEAKKFAPELKVLPLQGADRQRWFPEIVDSHLVVTSYALIRRDAERYQGVEFDTVVLDEAQHIKNRQTLNAQAVKSIRSRHRLVLTGTPLENSVFDLWSIFDFLMPGYLGSASDFRGRYELPISKGKDSSASARLGRRLRPFILRRLKQEVARDLPAKLEQVSFCELSDSQRRIYQQVLEAGRKEMLQAGGEPGASRGRMLVLTTLLRLRQICCDPRLLKLESMAKDEGSGKVDLFGELLQEVLDGGHRVLVFSQFTEMLALLRDQLEEDGVEYCYLDGGTPNRGEVVDRFQRGQAPVFLISLKAGGVGLNLTAADTVIHFDPWWNPAVEDQATDRAHRIGQSRVVTSYKLIARDTVEEKILTLQQRKRELTVQTLGSEESFTQALSWEEIQELLQ